jgi:hypothetical protein
VPQIPLDIFLPLDVYGKTKRVVFFCKNGVQKIFLQKWLATTVITKSSKIPVVTWAF